MHQGVPTEIVGLSKHAEAILIDDRNYQVKHHHGGGSELQIIATPVPNTLKVATLLGLVTLAEAAFSEIAPSSHVIHVVDPETVRVVPINADEYGQRPTIVEANALKGHIDFRYGEYYSQEEAIIRLNAFFAADRGDIDYVLRLISTIATKDKLQLEDNGVSQAVSTMASTHFANEDTTAIKPRVALAPYRTFREIEQPTSNFILRVKKDPRTQEPTVGLFEADGGEWKLEAIEGVRQFLDEKLNPAIDPTKGEMATFPRWVISA
jgi:hypothetical protein